MKYFHIFINLQLTENHVTIRVRQVDLPLVESLLDSVQNAYKQITKKDVTIKVDQDNFLPSDSCGGVDLFAAKGIYILYIQIYTYIS